MMFCLDDGAELLYGPATGEPQTATNFDTEGIPMFGSIEVKPVLR